MLGLEGKVVLVTGGGRGLGKGIVELLSKLGARVAYTYRKNPCDINVDFSIKADVCNFEGMKQVIDKIEKDVGNIYGIVANAGITSDGFCSKLSVNQWNDVISTNLSGVYNTVSPALPFMYERLAGSIVFISSVVGERGNAGQVNYAASKAGLIGMAKSLALESARYGVRVNALSPGFIETEMTDKIPDRVKQNILATIPMKRFAKVSEIAWSAVMLLSPVVSSYVTGISFSANGGQHT